MKALVSSAIACLLFLATNAGATNVWHTAAIKFIYPYAGGNRFVLGFVTDHAGCTNGSMPNKYYYIVPGQNGLTTDDAKMYFATATLAFSMNKPLSIFFDDASSSCYVNAMILTN
jgi:hypothetical protein